MKSFFSCELCYIILQRLLKQRAQSLNRGGLWGLLTGATDWQCAYFNRYLLTACCERRTVTLLWKDEACKPSGGSITWLIRNVAVAWIMACSPSLLRKIKGSAMKSVELQLCKKHKDYVHYWQLCSLFREAVRKFFRARKKWQNK